MIYYARINDKIKIGYSHDPTSRISGLRTSSPYELVVELVLSGGYDKERDLHETFRHLRIRGEWFEYGDEIKAHIANNMADDRRYEFGLLPDADFEGNQQIARIMSELKLNCRTAGELMGVSKQRVSDIRRREGIGAVTITAMTRIAAVFGCKFEYRFVHN